jgi:putative redox protein
MATKLSITNLATGYQSLITNGKHAIVGDEPLNSMGTDLGFSPPELLLSGIAMCKAATVKNGWEIGNVNAELSQETKRGKDGKLSTRISTSIKIEGDLTEEQKNELLAQADRCYVVRMIEGDWEMEHAVDMEAQVLG